MKEEKESVKNECITLTLDECDKIKGEDVGKVRNQRRIWEGVMR